MGECTPPTAVLLNELQWKITTDWKVVSELIQYRWFCETTLNTQRWISFIYAPEEITQPVLIAGNHRSTSYLPGNSYLFILFISKWTLFPVMIVKCQGYTCLGNASLTSFVHKVLQASSTHLSRGGGKKNIHTHWKMCSTAMIIMDLIQLISEKIWILLLRITVLLRELTLWHHKTTTVITQCNALKARQLLTSANNMQSNGHAI